jgi:hypothetical protein
MWNPLTFTSQGNGMTFAGLLRRKEQIMKKLLAMLLLAAMAPTLIGCEASGKVDGDDDHVKVKAKVDTD